MADGFQQEPVRLICDHRNKGAYIHAAVRNTEEGNSIYSLHQHLIDIALRVGHGDESLTLYQQLIYLGMSLEYTHLLNNQPAQAVGDEYDRSKSARVSESEEVVMQRAPKVF